MKKLHYLLAAVAFGSLAITTGCATQPTTPPAQVTILFGRTGGNIRPYTITVAPSGLVTSDYPSDCIIKDAPLSKSQLANVNKLAQASAFQSLPDEIGSHLPNPDRASLFVEVKTATTDKRVIKASGTDQTFDTLFATLSSLTTKSSCNL